MADISITAASVLASATASTTFGTGGATITAGQPVYRDTTDLDDAGQGKFKLSDANLAAAARIDGIALNGCSAGQPLKVALGDPDFAHGLAGRAAGDFIILSATAGALAPVADLASGMFPCLAMICTSATKANLTFVNGTVAKA